MKNALIVTWFSDSNYGQVLQAYAMQRIVSRFGIDSWLLTFRGSTWLEYYILNHNKKFGNRIFIRQLVFECFVRKYLQITHPCNNRKKIKAVIKEKKIDILFCGSDQIWNPSVYDPVAFLDFDGAYDLPRIAYAPSIASKQVAKYYSNTLKKMKISLDKLSHISVREKSGCEIVEELTGHLPVWVLDPVLLLPKKYWQRKMCIKDEPSDYLLCFFYGNSDKYIMSIKRIMEIHRIKNVICIGTKCNCLGKFMKDAGPKTFLNLMYNAKAVCTDAFHGVAFSIDFNKQFYVYNRNDNKETKRGIGAYYNFDRIESILGKVGLKNRVIIENHIEDVGEIDYDLVEKILKTERAKSWKYLKESIEQEEIGI